MNRTLKWIALGLGLVLLILLVSRLVDGRSFLSDSLKANLLSAGNNAETLTVVPTDIPALSFGSVVEVYQFKLEAPGPYTLRYLSFWLETHDLEMGPPQDWSVYKMNKDVVDYSQKVGQGEALGDGLLKLRFYSERSKGYLGEPGDRFALVTKLKRNGEAPELILKVADSSALLPFYQWAWKEGHFDEAWENFKSS